MEADVSEAVDNIVQRLLERKLPQNRDARAKTIVDGAARRRRPLPVSSNPHSPSPGLPRRAHRRRPDSRAKCPRGHVLVREPAPGSWKCAEESAEGGCDKDAARNGRESLEQALVRKFAWRCRECDYAICIECLEQGRNRLRLDEAPVDDANAPTGVKDVALDEAIAALTEKLSNAPVKNKNPKMTCDENETDIIVRMSVAENDNVADVAAQIIDRVSGEYGNAAAAGAAADDAGEKRLDASAAALEIGRLKAFQKRILREYIDNVTILWTRNQSSEREVGLLEKELVRLRRSFQRMKLERDVAAEEGRRRREEEVARAAADATEAADGEIEHLRRQIEERDDAKLCIICLENEKNTVFRCGHVSCGVCADRLRHCHICRNLIVEKFKFFYV